MNGGPLGETIRPGRRSVPANGNDWGLTRPRGYFADATHRPRARDAVRRNEPILGTAVRPRRMTTSPAPGLAACSAWIGRHGWARCSDRYRHKRDTHGSSFVA